MNILIIGMDGYLGWALAVSLLEKGHAVSGIDNFKRRRCVNSLGSDSAIPIVSMENRLLAIHDIYNKNLDFFCMDVSNGAEYGELKRVISFVNPEAIVHLGEIPSAPYSMASVEKATEVQINNVIGTLNILYAMKEVCPKAHLVKLGTMGEYGTPNIDIPEGFFEVEYNNRRDYLPFPKQAGSWYHQSKVHDTNNIIMACKIWGLRSTDIMQGVVYGTNALQVHDKRLYTRLDFDECFGTVIHRFCCQAIIAESLSVYGKGNQKRGFLSLIDSVKCMTLTIESPPKRGEYRTFNQFEEVYSILELAQLVSDINEKRCGGAKVPLKYIKNPRVEKDNHYYNPEHKLLFDLGYQPHNNLEGQIRIMLSVLSKYKNRIEERKKCLTPSICWKD